MAETTKKPLAMRENPELFKDYLKAVKRAGYLSCTICLCDDIIELYAFRADRKGIDFVQTFKAYDSENLKKINALLDQRADLLKEQWLWSYQQLNNSASAGERWTLDLSQRDYAILIDGSSLSQAKHYHMEWGYEDLENTARYIANCVNPDEESVERLQGQIIASAQKSCDI